MNFEGPEKIEPEETENEIPKETEMNRRSFLKRGGLALAGILAGLGSQEAEAGEKKNEKKKEKEMIIPLGYSDEQLLKMGYKTEDIAKLHKQKPRTPPLGYTPEQLKKAGFTDEEIARGQIK